MIFYWYFLVPKRKCRFIGNIHSIPRTKRICVRNERSEFRIANRLSNLERIVLLRNSVSVEQIQDGTQPFSALLCNLQLFLPAGIFTPETVPQSLQERPASRGLKAEPCPFNASRSEESSLLHKRRRKRISWILRRASRRTPQYDTKLSF